MSQKQFIFNKIVTSFLNEYKQIINTFFDNSFENEINNSEKYFLKLLYNSTFKFDVFDYYKSQSKEIKIIFFKDFTFFLYSKNLLVLLPFYLNALYIKCSNILHGNIIKLLNIQEISELLNTTVFSNFLYQTLKETQTYNIYSLLNNDNESYRFFLHMCHSFLNWKKKTAQQKEKITISDIDQLLKKTHLSENEEDLLANVLLQTSLNEEAANIYNDDVLNPFESKKTYYDDDNFDVDTFLSGAMN